MAPEMHERKALLLRAEFPQPAGVPAVELKFMKVLRWHLPRDLTSVLVSNARKGRASYSEVLPQLDVFDEASGLEISIRIDHHHPSHQGPIRFWRELRNGRIQLQNILRFVSAGPDEPVSLVGPQVIGPRE